MIGQFKRVSVLGLGYIGLPTAAMFASRKVEVIGFDVNPAVVDTVNNGKVHIIEPDLDAVVHQAVETGFLRATTKLEPAEAFLIAVPTPFKGDNWEPDISYVEAATAEIASVLAPGNLVVLESTSPVGTTEIIAGLLASARPDLTFPQTHGEDSDIRIAYCPERVLPGKVMQELISNDRVIGGMTPACTHKAADLYKTFVDGDCVFATSPRIAEMAKLTENSFRDVNIAFANELSMVCSELAIDVWELIPLVNRHPRVNVLQPGPGVGGHCIAVDPWFIVSQAPKTARLIRMAREVNDYKQTWAFERVVAEARAIIPKSNRLKIALYGLAFKPDINDFRESPALAIANRIAALGIADLLVVEPFAETLPDDWSGAVLTDMEGASFADLHVLLVDHTAFRTAGTPDGKLVDFRGIWTTSPMLA